MKKRLLGRSGLEVSALQKIQHASSNISAVGDRYPESLQKRIDRETQGNARGL
jgi:hypothetical protein